MNELEYITVEPANAAVPLARLDGSPIPQGQVYRRNSFPMPDPGEVSGEIEMVLPGHRSRTVTPDDLAALPQTTQDIVLECAGNGRSLMRPVPSGVAWGLGGASPVRVRGVRLIDAIGDIPEEATELVFTGLDHGEVQPEGVVNYQFSVDADLVRTGTPLLVTHLGEEPLGHEHGGPIRLVVPGHYAMKSVKWLARIEAVPEPFTGHFVKRYRYRGDHQFEDESAVETIQVRSVISLPGEGARLPAGRIALEGSAWSGYGQVSSVTVSTDDGQTWSEADLAPGDGKLAATAWRHHLVGEPGTHTVMARATDSAGNTQPLHPRWNKNGYANNVVHTVSFEVI